VEFLENIFSLDGAGMLIAVAAAMFAVIGGLSLAAHFYTLQGIKSKTVGDGQHGTARWATKQEIQKYYKRIPFKPGEWRKGEALPQEQGLVVGSVGKKNAVTALVDTDDIHLLMIGASGVGKTAFFLYPSLEYACASGMSFLALDTKGDLARSYGAVASKYYGYNIAVIDLRNPTRSDGYNLLTLINRYMDICRSDPQNISARAKAEKYAKILAKTIVNPQGDAADHGQNAFFYDAAEGLLAAVVLLLAEYLPPDEENPQERRHIVSVFKLVQELLAPAKGARSKNSFQTMMDLLPETHKARWFAGAALNSADQAMASVMSTVLSRLNAFLDSELEQVLCFDSAIDAETFASEKSAIFLILPEEDSTKNFMAGLMIQTLSRELFAVADENGGKLKNRVVLFCDELGTMPPFDILPLFSAGRSRKLTLVPIIQSLAQLEKNYGKEGAEIIRDNCQDTIFGGFAPGSHTADELSKALGSRTVMSGSVSRGKNDPSQSLQMMERPLMMPDELKNLPKGQFVVMKTGAHPMRTRLRLFLDWGISFGDPYLMPEKAARSVAYADKPSLMRSITATNPRRNEDAASAPSAKSGGMQDTDGPTQAFEADESMQELEQRHGQQKPYNTRRHREQERQP
jgi:type IV secretion system protein VirD4